MRSGRDMVSPSTSLKPGTHLRIARATDNLDEVVRFYRDGLGLEVLDSFEDHDGFDGIMLGRKGLGYHLEFTRKRGHVAGRSPTQDNLLVFYIEDGEALAHTVARLRAHGHEPVAPENPYWAERGVTFEDPDGWRVVLMNTAGVAARDAGGG